MNVQDMGIVEMNVDNKKLMKMSQDLSDSKKEVRKLRKKMKLVNELIEAVKEYGETSVDDGKEIGIVAMNKMFDALKALESE